MYRPLEDEEFAFDRATVRTDQRPRRARKDGTAFRYDQPRQIIDSGFVLTDEIRAKLGDLSFGGLDDRRPGLFETYHCDDTYTAEPAIATVLHARDLPPSGGGPTHFLDMRAAYQLLDEATRERISRLRVRYAFNNEGAFPTGARLTGPPTFWRRSSTRSCAPTPSAGTRSLFLDLDRAKHIEGLPVDEGRALLQWLQDHAEA